MELVGSWKLVEWRAVRADGSVTFPLGQDARGMIIYAADGGMSATMTASDRPIFGDGNPFGGDAAEQAAAYGTCLVYCGTWESDGVTVSHQVLTSSYPAWAGIELHRRIGSSGDNLVLSTQPGPDGAAHELVWSPLGPN